MSKKIKLSNLIPDQRNNNKHTPFGMDLLAKSVEQNGILESITVSNDDVIISGNARQEVIGNKFITEPIIIETDGTRPVILKRTDIQSNTKEFYRASIMANTTSKKNIDIDTDIVEVLAEEYDLDIQEMGVDNVLTMPNEDELIGEGKNKAPAMKITFKTPEQLQKAEVDLVEILDAKYSGYYYSVSCGEI